MRTGNPEMHTELRSRKYLMEKGEADDTATLKRMLNN